MRCIRCLMYALTSHLNLLVGGQKTIFCLNIFLRDSFFISCKGKPVSGIRWNKEDSTPLDNFECILWYLPTQWRVRVFLRAPAKYLRNAVTELKKTNPALCPFLMCSFFLIAVDLSAWKPLCDRTPMQPSSSRKQIERLVYLLIY